jgi:hypothetical protein
MRLNNGGLGLPMSQMYFDVMYYNVLAVGEV